MSTQANPVVTQQQITPKEVQYFLTDVLTQTSAQFHPGKLVINPNNSDILQRYVREHDPAVVTVVRTLLETRQYQQAVRTLTSAYVQAVKMLMFNLPSPLQWEKVHPAITKRRALEAEQRGEVKQKSNDDGQTEWFNKTEQAKADDAEAKLEAKYERDVNDLIERVYFINPVRQTPDYKRIDDLKADLRDDVAKARKNGHKWGKIHAYVLNKINNAYKAAERETERWNSR